MRRLKPNALCETGTSELRFLGGTEIAFSVCRQPMRLISTANVFMWLTYIPRTPIWWTFPSGEFVDGVSPFCVYLRPCIWCTNADLKGLNTTPSVKRHPTVLGLDGETRTSCRCPVLGRTFLWLIHAARAHKHNTLYDGCISIFCTKHLRYFM